MFGRSFCAEPVPAPASAKGFGGSVVDPPKQRSCV